MGAGLAFGTGFVQKTQQRADEARAEDAYNRLQDRAVKDYEYKSGVDTDAAEELAKRKNDLAQTEEDRIRTRREAEAVDLFKGLSGNKLLNAKNDYVNDPTASGADILNKWGDLHEGKDGAWETAAQNKISTAVQGYSARIVGTPYEGSPYAEDVNIMLKQGTSLLDIKDKFQENVGADGKIYMQPKPKGAGDKGLKAFEVKGLREAGDMQLFDPVTLQFAKIKRTRNLDGSTSYAGTDPVANEYIAHYRTAVRENYDYLFRKTKRAPGFEDAAQQAHSQMVQQYGTMSQYITNRKAGGRPIGATQETGTQPIPKEMAAKFVQELAGQDPAAVVAQHTEDLKAFGNTVYQMVQQHPEYAEALGPVFEAAKKALVQ